MNSLRNAKCGASPKLVVALGLGLGGVAWMSPSRAEACSAPTCLPSYFVPEQGTQVPANLPALYWRTVVRFANPSLGVDLSAVRLTSVDDPMNPIPLVSHEVNLRDRLLELSRPLVAGTMYRLVDTSTCAFAETEPLEVDFEATDEAPWPSTQLGTIRSSEIERLPMMVVETASGSCSAAVDAVVMDVEVELATDVIPWKDVLLFETLVDGEVWSQKPNILATRSPGASAWGRGRDRLYRVCRHDDPGVSLGLTKGSHEVVMKARLPGTPLEMTSTPILVELRCEGDGNTEQGADGGTDAGLDAGNDQDSGPNADGNVDANPDVDERNGTGGRAEMNGEGSADLSSGCSATTADQSLGGLLLCFALIGVIGLLRTARRTRTSK
ncbi:MAG: hypothetical protein H6729_12300 [Deltaproteobacteria bacterium]|nr:hypothetical protein [Deltaproteobacteria bacterium]